MRRNSKKAPKHAKVQKYANVFFPLSSFYFKLFKTTYVYI